MTKTEKIIQSVFSAVDYVNQSLPQEEQLEKSVDTVLFGRGGKLDSLGIVNLIVATEEAIEEEFGVTITLADEKAMSQKNSPFQTVESLVNYILSLLNENADG